MADDSAVPPAPSPAPSPRPSNFNADGELDPSTPSGVIKQALQQQDVKPVRCAKFRQQELWAWKPVWSPTVIVIMYFLVAAIFIPLGIVLLVQTTGMFASPLKRYDGGACQVGDQTTDTTPPKRCLIRLNIDKEVKAPSYFYYGVTNFYQNARTYVTSRSDAQLGSEDPTANVDTSTCDPMEKFSNGSVINPCGLVAGSQFNDSFELCRDLSCTNIVTFNSTGIAWDIDRNSRFASRFSEDFMVWMRVAAFRNWKKLYRIIEEDLEKGDYWVRVESNFPVSGFDGKKFFYISETSWFGGPNLPLAVSYLVVGSLSLMIAIFFAIRSRMVRELELPPKTTVYLEGLVKNPIKSEDVYPLGSVPAA